MTREMTQFAAVVTLITAVFAVYKFLQTGQIEGVQVIAAGGVSNKDGLLFTPLGRAVLPNDSPTDAGFSNFSRVPPDQFRMELAGGAPLAYGLTIPQ